MEFHTLSSQHRFCLPKVYAFASDDSGTRTRAHAMAATSIRNVRSVAMGVGEL